MRLRSTEETARAGAMMRSLFTTSYQVSNGSYFWSRKINAEMCTWRLCELQIKWTEDVEFAFFSRSSFDTFRQASSLV